MDRERLGRAAGDRDDQVLEPDAAASGNRGRERLAADAKPQVRYLVGKPLASALLAPGEPGERSGKVCARSRASATARSLSNAGGSVGTARPQRRRLADAESRD